MNADWEFFQATVKNPTGSDFSQLEAIKPIGQRNQVLPREKPSNPV